MELNTLSFNIGLVLLYIVVYNFSNYNFLLNCILLILILINHNNRPFSILLMTLIFSRNCNSYIFSEGFSSNKKKNIEKEDSESEDEEEEDKQQKKLKEKKNKTEKNDLVLKAVKEDFITKLLGDGLIQKKQKKNKKDKETFETKIPKYKIDTNVDHKINQLDKAIQMFKQQLG